MAGLCSAYRPQPGAEPDSADGLRGPRREGSDPHRLGGRRSRRIPVGNSAGHAAVCRGVLGAGGGREPSGGPLCGLYRPVLDGFSRHRPAASAPGRRAGHAGPANPAKYLLYQDVLLGLFDTHVPEERDAPVFAAAADAMRAAALRNPQTALFETLEKLAAVLACKADLGVRLRRAYQEGDRQALCRQRETLRRLPDLCEALYRAVCRQWAAENKPFGREVLDMRFGTLAFRLRAALETLDAYLRGPLLPFQSGR